AVPSCARRIATSTRCSGACSPRRSRASTAPAWPRSPKSIASGSTATRSTPRSAPSTASPTGCAGPNPIAASSILGPTNGAPPSRTNPEGQPWSYGVLDPALYGTRAQPGPAVQLLRLRVGKLLSELDGLRIDHPHGLIDPWVYRAAQPDPLRAVQQGARLFSSPDLPDPPQ